MTQPPFLIGSRVYGEPREDSDIDLVIKVDDLNLFDMLFQLSDSGLPGVCRFGKLNLIPCWSDEQYNGWVDGLKEVMALKAETGKPVSRAQAIEIFQRQRELHGIRPSEVEAQP